jgi:hypothetical protein
LDLEHYGLVAAANALGLSSPSMGHFLASVKEQVAKEQVEIRKKREVDKVPTCVERFDGLLESVQGSLWPRLRPFAILTAFFLLWMRISFNCRKTPLDSLSPISIKSMSFTNGGSTAATIRKRKPKARDSR